MGLKRPRLPWLYAALLMVLLPVVGWLSHAAYVAVFYPPCSSPELEGRLRREAEEIVRTREQEYGHLPAHRWPPQEREVYESARATLEELRRRGR